MRLRRANLGDLAFLVELSGDPSVEPWLFPGAGEPEALRGAIEGAQAPDGIYVIEAGDGSPLGALQLSVSSRRSRIGQLSRMMVAPASRGSGVALRAVELIGAMAFGEHGFHRLEAEVYGDNLAGQRLLERAGFTREGVRRQAYWRRERWLDGILFGLLADEASG